MTDFSRLRQQMIEHQLRARGLQSEQVINAVNAVPREEFVATELVEFAYNDSPLPIAASQTISQPYLVALMISAAKLTPQDRILEVGTGSGYAAAVLANISQQVYSIERHKILADSARQRLKQLGYEQIKIAHADGTLGWSEHAPFDAIIMTAGVNKAPEALQQQLAIGGRLILPIGPDDANQTLLRITRVSEHQYQHENLGDIRFVPLLGVGEDVEDTGAKPGKAKSRLKIEELIYQSSEHFASIEAANLNNLIDRIGDSQIVLLGEASHGSAEFYDMRARITKELITQKGFTIIAVEADWPDAAHINHFINDTSPDPLLESPPFTRFPSWMWANHSVLAFSRWLKAHNKSTTRDELKSGFYGLDLYSLNTSIQAVLNYLDSVDPETAEIARIRYGCLTPWSRDPSLYSQLMFSKQYRECEHDVIATLQDLLKQRLNYSIADGERYFNAEQNARLVADAERYYRTMYYAENNSWNQRDQHMFDTLEAVLAFRGPAAKAVVWEHNSHIGDARATQMSARGEFNIGQLVRQKYLDKAYLIGFGTDHGTVAAASEWGGPMEIKQINAAHIDSYERLCHQVPTDNFMLPLSQPINQFVREQLLPERLERAIGVIYRPETELQSHYFYASLARQFDEYIWFDESSAVEPINREVSKGVLDTFPFGL